MKINDRLKKFIFKKLAQDFYHVEVIPYKGSIWFIDRNDKYWYLELENNGHLWWRYDFFNGFFQAFSLERIDYESLIAEWVEEVLNHKVITTCSGRALLYPSVEDVLNHKVITTGDGFGPFKRQVEDVLNHKVITTGHDFCPEDLKVEQVLNHKVITTGVDDRSICSVVEQVLNSK
jgi:hypothetical protein